jgi:hypothetical protein
MVINTEPLRGTIFGNLKIPKLGKVEITFMDLSVESREINSLGTTVFESKGERDPFKVKILGKEYILTDFPTKVDLGNEETTMIHEFPFSNGDATIILIGLDVASETFGSLS